MPTGRGSIRDRPVFLGTRTCSSKWGLRVAVLLADVLDRRRMETIFRSFSPTIVFHAAAYKHVPLMELHPGEAVKNIILATRQVADLSAEHGVDSFVLISYRQGSQSHQRDGGLQAGWRSCTSSR